MVGEANNRTIGGCGNELLLTLGAADVSRRVGLPLTFTKLLVTAAPGECQGLQPIEQVAACRLVKSGLQISGGVRETDRYSTEFVHDVAEANKVDFDIVMDRDTKRFDNCGHQSFCTSVVRRVDAIAPTGAGNFDPQVSGQTHDRGSPITFSSQHHDRVCPPATHHIGVADYTKIWVVFTDPLSGV